MALGLVGRKVGMTRMFQDDGESVPVTVVEVEPNRITDRKTVQRDGYDAVQLTTGVRRPRRVNKAAAGHYQKAGAGVAAGRGLWEFRIGEREADGDDQALQPGAELKVDLFSEGQAVDVQGLTIGKGFAGVMKRHGYRGGRATHGNSRAHRKPGSIGQNQDPGRVFPGKKMAGHMGHVICTVQNLRVVRVDTERNLLLIRGAVPGARGTDLMIRPSTRGARRGETS